MYPIYCKYVLHGQDSGFHFLIPDLKRSTVFTFFIFAGILLLECWNPKFLERSIFYFLFHSLQFYQLVG